MRARLPRILVVFAVLGIGGYVAFQNYWYYLPALIAAMRDPIQPNHEVSWEQGPIVASTAATDRPPSIVLIVADDLGYNDLTFGGGGVAGGAVRTPNIDSIAQQGAILQHAYAGDATCAPSRAALLTGRYATRFGFEFTPVPVQFARQLGHTGSETHPAIYHPELEKDVPEMARMTVPSDERMLPQLLQARGYHTMMLGKWHVGETAAARPEARGFDEYLRRPKATILWRQGLRLRRHASAGSTMGLHAAHQVTWRRGEGAACESSVSGTPLGRGAESLVVESVPTTADPMGEEGRQL